jgi:hypothetical protein
MLWKSLREELVMQGLRVLAVMQITSHVVGSSMGLVVKVAVPKT